MHIEIDLERVGVVSVDYDLIRIHAEPENCIGPGYAVIFKGIENEAGEGLDNVLKPVEFEEIEQKILDTI